MTKPPVSSEPKTKTVNDKKYHWCKGNEAHKPKWVIHEPKDCKGHKGTTPGSETPMAATPAPTLGMHQPAWNVSSALIMAKESK